MKMRFIYLSFFLIVLQESTAFNVRSMRKVTHNHRELHKDHKILLIDIDNTICRTDKSNYLWSLPIYEHINRFNEIYECGHEVNYWTARGAVSGENWDDFTIKQLNFWNVKYDNLLMGKPHYDIWIDDKAINIEDLDKLNIK